MLQFIAGSPSFTAKFLHAAHTSLAGTLSLDAAQEAAAAYVARLRSLGIPDSDAVSYVKAAVTAG